MPKYEPARKNSEEPIGNRVRMRKGKDGRWQPVEPEQPTESSTEAPRPVYPDDPRPANIQPFGSV